MAGLPLNPTLDADAPTPSLNSVTWPGQSRLSQSFIITSGQRQVPPVRLVPMVTMVTFFPARNDWMNRAPLRLRQPCAGRGLAGEDERPTSFELPGCVVLLRRRVGGTGQRCDQKRQRENKQRPALAEPGHHGSHPAWQCAGILLERNIRDDLGC